MQTLLYRVRQIIPRIPGIDLGLRADGSAMLDQQFYGFRSPHQSRGSAQLVFRVDVGVKIQQHAECIQIARTRGQHQRRLAPRAALVHVRAVLQQLLDHCGASVLRREIQRRRAFAIRQLDVRARGNQHVGHFQVVAISSPLDGSCAIRLHGVHVGFLLHQRLHGRPIAVHGRVG
jgi:hypothetical protein